MPKTPLTEHGCKDATTSPEIIKGWWMRWPAANVGIATGRESNLVAFDFDIKNGQQGQQTYMDLLDRYGTIETLTNTTPSGGWHLSFQYPDIPVSNRAGLLPGLDIRGVWWLYRGTRIKYARGRIHLEKPYSTAFREVSVMTSYIVMCAAFKQRE